MKRKKISDRGTIAGDERPDSTHSYSLGGRQ